ncbi:MAG: tetratricopeptide repeat protein, partial [Thermoanaerobaculia bacterium]
VKITLRHADDPDTGPEPIYTNAKGRWAQGGLAGGAWTVLLDMEGYQPSQGSVQVSEFAPNEGLNVTLEPDPFASIGVGDKFLESSRFAEARVEYEKAMSNLDPVAAARLRSRIGDTYLAEGDYAAARREYEQALPHIEPGEQAHIRLQVANSYQLEGRHSEARQAYEEVLPLLAAAGRAEVLVAVARSYDQEGNRDQAIATLERGLELNPGNVDLLQVIADLLTRAGREVEAQEYLAQVPDDVDMPADLLLNIGIRFYNDGDMDQAYDHFNRALEQNPDLAETYYYRGVVYLGRGENEQARADFHKLLELEPDTPRAEEVKEFLKYLE